MLEIGEYVRTKKYGDIGKLLKITSTKIYLDSIGYPIDKDEMANHSKNIKDLIKHGDYVNGEFVWLSNGFYIPEGKMFVGDLEQGHYLDEIEIKTILTKEQYEANCYKVKEE